MFENRRWIIVSSNIVNEIDFSEVLNDGIENLTYSIDGTKVLIKYDVYVIEETYTNEIFNPISNETESVTVNAGVYGRPSIYSEGMIEYTHNQILEILSSSEWTKELDYTK